MPKLTITNDNLTIDVEPGAALIQVCRQHETSIPFGCREGTCGTCLIRVEKNPANLSPATKREKDTLASLGSEPEERLGCQCKILGDVTISLVE